NNGGNAPFPEQVGGGAQAVAEVVRHEQIFDREERFRRAVAQPRNGPLGGVAAEGVPYGGGHLSAGGPKAEVEQTASGGAGLADGHEESGKQVGEAGILLREAGGHQ